MDIRLSAKYDDILSKLRRCCGYIYIYTLSESPYQRTLSDKMIPSVNKVTESLCSTTMTQRHHRRRHRCPSCSLGQLICPSPSEAQRPLRLTLRLWHRRVDVLLEVAGAVAFLAGAALVGGPEGRVEVPIGGGGGLLEEVFGELEAAKSWSGAGQLEKEKKEERRIGEKFLGLVCKR